MSSISEPTQTNACEVLGPIEPGFEDILTPEAMATLDGQAQWLLTNTAYSALIEGHADERGSREYNIGLGERRAQAVANHLIGRGVDASRITALGYGEGHPIASNDTAGGRSRNRRVDLLLKAKVK